MLSNRCCLFLSALVFALCATLLLSGDARAEDKPIEIKAVKLAETYATDSAAFDKNYKDKVVEVEGVVDSPKVQDFTTKKNFVLLKGFQKKGDPIPTLVRCEMTKDLEGLKAGDKVRIKGTCRGYNKTVLFPEVGDCTLLKEK